MAVFGFCVQLNCMDHFTKQCGQESEKYMKHEKICLKSVKITHKYFVSIKDMLVCIGVGAVYILPVVCPYM